MTNRRLNVALLMNSLVKTDILRAIIQWMEKRHFSFSLLTEASINLADDDDLMRTIVQAQFDKERFY